MPAKTKPTKAKVHPDTARIVEELSRAVEADKRSRPEIAAAGGLALPTMHRVLAGERSPKLDVIVRIVRGLGKKIRISD